MSRPPWKRALAALLVVMACTLAVPANANAAAANMDTLPYPSRIWNRIMDWVGRFWATPAARAPHNVKFGAGQSSDGGSRSQSSL
jgi:hypothetical protein